MRCTWAVIIVLFASPAFAAAPPLCALPAPAPTAGAPAGGVDGGIPASAPTAARAARAAALAAVLPQVLAQIPFAEHVAAAGATLTDLGASHGLHGLAARSGDQFMLFEVTPDGKAAVSGAPIDLSVAELRSIAAGNITELGKAHGLDGFFVRSGPHFQVFYASPDGQRVVPGVLWNATGKDLTRRQVASVPGAIPTVRVGAAALSGSATSALPLVERATFGTIGPASAPHLFMLIDPQCIYSMRALQMLRPYAEAGRIQISVIPLAVLDYEDHGQSTRSALALLSDPGDRIVAAWQSGSLTNPVSAEAPSLLRRNMAIAEAIGLKGTPTFIWRKPDGTEGRLDGVPVSVSAFIASIGS